MIGTGPATRVIAVLVLAAAACPGGAAPAFARALPPQGTLAVRGRVIDADGAGVPGQVVRLLKSRTYVKLGGLKSLDQSVEDARATTDSMGFFEILLVPDPAFAYAYVRFYDPKTFDTVKYVLPDDRDISKNLREGRPVQISVMLRFAPDWPQVVKLLETYPPATQAGQVIRSLGLPSGREPEGPGRELWTYPKAGVAYIVEGSKVIETRRIEPVSGTAAKTAASPDDAVPAVRVDAP